MGLMRAIKPLSRRKRLALALWEVRTAIHNSILGLYVVFVLLVNRIWRIQDRSRKSKRLLPPKDKTRLKVGIVSEYYYPHMGGLSGDVHYAAVEFAKMGYEVKLITPNVEPEHNILKSPLGFEFIRIGKATPYFANASMSKISFDWRIGKKVKEMLEREKFDVIHIHCPVTPVLPLLIQLYANCKIVGHIHMMLLSKPFFFKVFHRFIRACVHDFDGMVAVSEVSAQPWKEWFGGEYKAIPNGIPYDEFQGVPKIKKFDDGRVNVFFIGRMETRNGISTLIDAFRIFHEEFPNSRLILAGDGPLRQYFEDEVEPALKPSVEFIGSILKEKPNYFATTSINVVPTNRIASLGVALLEAMSSDAPTVCSDLPAFRENVSPEEDVLLAHPDRPEEFAAAMKRFVEEPEFSSRLVRNAKEKMLRKFTWEAIIRRVDDYTNTNVLNRPSRQWGPSSMGLGRQEESMRGVEPSAQQAQIS